MEKIQRKSNIKKVAIIYAGARYFGGVETYILNLFKYIDKEKFELTLISLGEWELTDRLSINNYQLTIFDKRWWDVKNIFKIKKFLKENNFDLIVSQGMVANFYARKISFLSKIPSLVIVHSNWKLDYSGVKKILFWVFDRLLRRYTSKYICVSKYLKACLEDEGIKSSKIEVIYSGVEFKERHLVKSYDKDLVIGSIGRLHKAKNYSELIEAGKILSKKYGTKLKIWGEGPEYDKLQQKINSAPADIAGFALLEGYIENIEDALSQINIYIQPSLSEGFGFTVVEAMLAGLPIVVTPGGALKELVENGKTGIISEDFNHDKLVMAIEKYIKNAELRKKCASASQKFARKNFSMDKWINNIQKNILNLIL